MFSLSTNLSHFTLKEKHVKIKIKLLTLFWDCCRQVLYALGHPGLETLDFNFCVFGTFLNFHASVSKYLKYSFFKVNLYVPK